MRGRVTTLFCITVILQWLQVAVRGGSWMERASDDLRNKRPFLRSIAAQQEPSLEKNHGRLG